MLPRALFSRRARLTAMGIVAVLSVIVYFAVTRPNNIRQARSDKQALNEANQIVNEGIRSGNFIDPSVAQAEQNDSTAAATSSCISAAGTNASKLAACATQATP